MDIRLLFGRLSLVADMPIALLISTVHSPLSVYQFKRNMLRKALLVSVSAKQSVILYQLSSL